MRDVWGGDAAAPARLLPGKWAIAREVIGPGAHFTGTGLFREAGDGSLAYAEEGWLDLPDGSRLEGRQAYHFVPEPAGFSVYFDEKPRRLFHSVRLDREADGGFRGKATHLCREDLYSSRYHFAPDGTFETVHVVTGPKKDYTVRSRFTRLRIPGETA